MNATVKPFSQATRSGIVRCRWTVLRNYGNGQYVGALVTDTEFGREHNRVAAADVSLRDSAHFSWAASLLRSDTRTADGDSIQGNGGQAKCPFPGIQFTRNLNLEWRPNARLLHFSTFPLPHTNLFRGLFRDGSPRCGVQPNALRSK